MVCVVLHTCITLTQHMCTLHTHNMDYVHSSMDHYGPLFALGVRLSNALHQCMETAKFMGVCL